DVLPHVLIPVVDLERCTLLGLEAVGDRLTDQGKLHRVIGRRHFEARAAPVGGVVPRIAARRQEGGERRERDDRAGRSAKEVPTRDGPSLLSRHDLPGGLPLFAWVTSHANTLPFSADPARPSPALT